MGTEVVPGMFSAKGTRLANEKLQNRYRICLFLSQLSRYSTIYTIINCAAKGDKTKYIFVMNAISRLFLDLKSIQT